MGGLDQFDHILLDGARDEDLPHEALGFEDPVSGPLIRQHQPHGGHIRHGGLSEDAPQLLGRRMGDKNPEHKPVQLGLGQRVDPFHLDGILGRDHEEGLLQLIRFAGDGHLVLGHRLQERGLRFRRGAVHFIRQQEVGEDRPRRELKHLAAVAVNDELRPDDIGGHQVRRALHPAKRQPERLGERLGQEGLAQPRHAFQQDVAAGEKRREEQLDHVILADDHRRQLRLQRLERLAELLRWQGQVFAHGGGWWLVRDNRSNTGRYSGGIAWRWPAAASAPDSANSADSA